MMRMKKSELLMYIYFMAVMFFYTVNGSTLYVEDIKYIMIFAIPIGVLKIISTLKTDWKTLLMLMAIGLIIMFFFFQNHDTRMIMLVLSMFCALGEDRDKVINILFWTKLVSFVMVMSFGGYHHINTVALHGGILLLLYLCREEKGSVNYLVKISVFFLLTMVLNLYTHSGSALVVLSITLFLFVLKKTKIGMWLLKSKFLMFIYPFLLFCNYFFAAGVGENEIPFIGQYFSQGINKLYLDIVKFLDVATSSRLTLVKFSFVKFGVSLFGGNVDYSVLNLQQGQYFNLDSGFIWLVQGWGILMCILMMILTVLLMRYLIKTEEYNYIISAIAIALWAVNEDMLVSVGTNFLLIFIGQAVWFHFHHKNNNRRKALGRHFRFVMRKEGTGREHT